MTCQIGLINTLQIRNSWQCDYKNKLNYGILLVWTHFKNYHFLSKQSHENFRRHLEKWRPEIKWKICGKAAQKYEKGNDARNMQLTLRFQAFLNIDDLWYSRQIAQEIFPCGVFSLTINKLGFLLTKNCLCNRLEIPIYVHHLQKVWLFRVKKIFCKTRKGKGPFM